jgi:hypothetical protein
MLRSYQSFNQLIARRRIARLDNDPLGRTQPRLIAQSPPLFGGDGTGLGQIWRLLDG